MATSSLSSDLFRRAEETDTERIWQIIGQAKAQMQRLGSQQWDEHYPTIEHIRQDIQEGNGYVICREGRVVAYGVISFDGEPAYEGIKGKWSNDLPYVIVHRLAIADEMKRQGMAKQFMLQAEEVSRKRGVYNFRVDTKYDNAYMLRLIDSLGFHYCGEVYYRNNCARRAFEKEIPPCSHPAGETEGRMEEQEIRLNEHNKQEYPPMHTAEHILNQTMVRMFGCPRSKNAHIERKKSKCDYELPEEPTADRMAEVERRVNEVIDRHLPVTIEYVTKTEAAAIVDLSKLPEETSEVLRIVRIGDYDACACIGAHVNNTSEIGHFKMLTYDYADGRLRLRFKLQ